MNYLRRLVDTSGTINYLLKQKLSTKHPRFAYVNGWIGRNNLGDEILLEAAKRLFPKASMIPYPDAGGRVVTSVSKVLNLFEYGLMAGGTVINKSPRQLRVAEESFGLNKKNIVFGSGVCDPTIWSKWPGWHDILHKWAPILNECAYVGVRGPISAKLLQDAGISKAEVIGDPVLALSDDAPNMTQYVPKTVGFNIGHAYNHVWGSEEVIQEEFVKLARFAKEANWKVKWVVVWPEDLEITKKVAKASGTDDMIQEVYNDYSEYMDSVRSLSTFVGMKLHAVALATCAFVPSLMLEYRPKCRDYMLAIGQGASTVRTDQFNAIDAWETIQHWDAERSMVSNALYQGIRPVRERQFQVASEVYNDLDALND